MKYKLIVVTFIWFQAHAETYEVSRLDDPVPNGCLINNCSLREAVISANINPGLDVIILGNGIHVLSINGTVEEMAEIGDLDVTDDLVVQGNNLNLTIIDAELITSRVFDIKFGVQFNISDLSIKNAVNYHGQGGAVRVYEASAQFNRVLIEDCITIMEGGGIAALYSDIEFNQSTLVNNRTGLKGGGIYLLSSTSLFDDSKILNNSTTGINGSGAGLYAQFQYFIQDNPVMSISNTLINSNESSLSGGGISLVSNSENPMDIAINNSQITNNQAENVGGGLYNIGKLNLTIEASIFKDNIAGTEVSFSGNGGGIFLNSGNFDILNSLLQNNHSGNYGGGIYSASDDSILNFINSTLSKNSASNHGAIHSDGPLNLEHVTSMLNASSFNADIGFGSTGTIINSIIYGECSGNGSSSLGGNIESPGDTCGLGSGTNDIVDLHPRFLGLNTTLGDYGGPTPTHIINSAASPAVGKAVVLPEITTDQRYFLRDNQPDSGATEQYPHDIDLIFRDKFEE